MIASAFRSAGQRCSALRLLCLQEDIADGVIAMGAAQQLAVGDPRDIATHVGPVIDAEAKDKLDAWVAGMKPRAAWCSARTATCRRRARSSCRRSSRRSTAPAT